MVCHLFHLVKGIRCGDSETDSPHDIKIGDFTADVAHILIADS
jgi:hypothetical protein